MSLTSALHCPRTPMRRFLDRELSAGPKPLRDNFRTQQRLCHTLAPPPGVGTEAGTVGTAIDYRLRLAFTTAAPLDVTALIGMELLRTARRTDQLMRSVGFQLGNRLVEIVQRLDLANRELPLDRAPEEEEDLARLLLAAAWYQVNTRSAIGFTFTPLAIAAHTDPSSFTLERLLTLPRRDMVRDVVAQVHMAATSPLDALRYRTRPEDCVPCPTFSATQVTADADLIVDGTLLDFKSTKHTHALPKADAWQLLGYLLMDTADQYRLDTVGLYLTRSGTLVQWPVEDYLDLLGACRRTLPGLRNTWTELLNNCTADAEPLTPEDAGHVHQLLTRLAPRALPGQCLVCTQPVPASSRRPRTYCSRWCSTRAHTLRANGLLTTHGQQPVRVASPVTPPSRTQDRFLRDRGTSERWRRSLSDPSAGDRSLWN